MYGWNVSTMSEKNYEQLILTIVSPPILVGEQVSMLRSAMAKVACFELSQFFVMEAVPRPSFLLSTTFHSLMAKSYCCAFLVYSRESNEPDVIEKEDPYRVLFLYPTSVRLKLWSYY